MNIIKEDIEVKIYELRTELVSRIEKEISGVVSFVYHDDFSDEYGSIYSTLSIMDGECVIYEDPLHEINGETIHEEISTDLCYLTTDSLFKVIKILNREL